MTASSQTEPEQKKHASLSRILKAAGIVLAALVLAFLVFVGKLISSAPDLDSINVSPEESATYICDSRGNPLRKLTLSTSNRDIVPLEQIPQRLQEAVIAIEDQRFYRHGGIDLLGISRAFLKGLVRLHFSEGASTITQQLIKNSVFTQWTQETSFLDRFSRKVQEQYLALQLEDRMSKEEILENYLNTINLGAGCYGVQAASRRYFGKDVQDLSLGEAAVLAAIPQNPTAYNPILHPEENQQRRQVVLTYMQEQGYITEAEKSEALSTEVYQEISVQNELYEESSVYSYYEDALIHQVLELLMEEKGYSSEQAYRAVFSGGLRIYSAQDSRIQEICDEEFLREENFPEGTEYGIDYALSLQEADGSVSHYGSEALRAFVQEHFDASFSLLCDSQETARSYADAFRASLLSGSGEASAPTVLGERLTLSPQPQASLVILEQDTGLVRAVVGGRGEKTASLTLNRATETTRQPGSTFKIPAVYAPALDACGKTLASLYDNEPCAYEDGTPVSNWDLSDYTGPVTIREAITRSINVAAVRCITEITPKLGFSYAVRMGISTLVSSSDIIQPLALGGITQGVTNLELCGAYASIANGGTYLEPLFFTKILDRHGNVVLDCTGETGEPGEPPLQEERRVLKESTAWLLTSAMEDVVAEENGTAYGSIKAASLPVAGKTGTTSSYKDIWFAGYTPYYTCCVWGGYDSNESLESGARAYSKTLWTAIMTRIHESLPQKDFSRPEDIVSVALCSESHLPARKGVCPDTYPEYFVKGTEPEESCGLHLPLRETEAPRLYQDILEKLPAEEEPEKEEPETKEDTETEAPGTERPSQETSSLEDLLERLGKLSP